MKRKMPEAGENNSKKRSMEESSTPSINIKVKGQDGVVVHFCIKRTTVLKKLLTAYCSKRNVDYNTVQFLYNGGRFSDKRSPDDLDMENEDEIDAMMHQNGGGCVGK